MKVVSSLIGLITMLIIFSCGKGTVDVENKSYEPKIVIEGYLIPHQKVDKIKIARNFRIDDNLNQTNLIPDVDKTSVSLTDLQSGNIYPMTFHVATDHKFDNYYWQYNGSQLKIEYGQKYKLDVTATIDGKELHASSTTRVPNEGFDITHINYRQLKYRQLNENNQLMNFALTIDRAPGTTFYVTTIQALNASKYNYVYNNPYANPDSADVEEDLIDWSYTYDWTQDTPETAGQTEIEMFWPYFMFYDKYLITTMACDVNYKEFLQTYNDVQEEDGNFHEAKFNIEGDGIGVFGSVVMDTLMISVIQ
jgi:hypothetical protein